MLLDALLESVAMFESLQNHSIYYKVRSTGIGNVSRGTPRPRAAHLEVLLGAVAVEEVLLEIEVHPEHHLPVELTWRCATNV